MKKIILRNINTMNHTNPQFIEINIYNLIGKEFCISADDGEKVFKQLQQAIKQQIKIKISFKNIKILTPAFLNSAIGQMYKDYTEEMKKYCSVEEMSDADKRLLKLVIENAKSYYSDPKKFSQSVKETLNE